MGSHFNACCNAKAEEAGNVDVDVRAGVPERDEEIVAG